jgi:serine phosphatase RsbU (regulator of sigma subunit)
MLDARWLFFMIGDVAGKGVLASLFMAISKVLCKQVADHGINDVGRITTELNAALSTENQAELFVTAVAVLLDVDTGEGQLCTAGHDAPLVVHPDGRVRSVDSSGGPPLCTLEEFDYPCESFTLAAGETMLLWTDGVGEASRISPAPVGTDVDGADYYARRAWSAFSSKWRPTRAPKILSGALYRRDGLLHGCREQR